MFAALADGTSTIEGYSTGADCASTLSCLRALGVSVTHSGQDQAGPVDDDKTDQAQVVYRRPDGDSRPGEQEP